MEPDPLFQIVNTMALAGWIVLLGSPLAPRFANLASGLAVPVLLAIAYTGIVLGHWTSAQGGFDSLANVALLFENRWMLLAGWIHYLAFDLFVGGWIVRSARDARIPFALVAPCLALTFLFGPAGFLAFSALRAGVARPFPANA